MLYHTLMADEVKHWTADEARNSKSALGQILREAAEI